MIGPYETSSLNLLYKIDETSYGNLVRIDSVHVTLEARMAQSLPSYIRKPPQIVALYMDRLS